MIDYTINNKFIKSEVYIKALNLLNNFYLKMYMTYMEDQIMNFILQKTAKSLYFSKKIGYFILLNTISISNNIHNISLLKIKFIFIYLKFIYEYSNNIKYQKDMANILFIHLYKKIELNILKSKNKDNIIFFSNVINM